MPHQKVTGASFHDTTWAKEAPRMAPPNWQLKV